jgi:hypothetical protein
MKKILYLCPEIPYPSDTGGKVAFANHINLITKNNTVDAIFLNTDEDGRALPESIINKFNQYKIFERSYKRANGIKGMLKLVLLFFRFKYPRAYTVRLNNDLRRYIRENLCNYDVIIFDHFSSFAFLNGFDKDKGLQSIYVSHNLEAQVIHDQFRLQKNYLVKLYLYIEFLKTRAVEKNIIKTVDKVVTISTSDYQYTKFNFEVKDIVNIPEVLPISAKRWVPHDSNVITFLGGSKYYPNYEAIDWLVRSLLPRLTDVPDAQIVFIGDCTNFIRENPDIKDKKNVTFMGYVADEDLDDMLLSSSIIISPILYGSGIKIKVLKAISLGIPIFCTKESLFGIEYLSAINDIVFQRENMNDCIVKLKRLLHDDRKLSEISSEIISKSEHQIEIIDQLWINLYQ